MCKPASVIFERHFASGISNQRDIILGIHSLWVHPNATARCSEYTPPLLQDRMCEARAVRKSGKERKNEMWRSRERDRKREYGRPPDWKYESIWSRCRLSSPSRPRESCAIIRGRAKAPLAPQTLLHTSCLYLRFSAISSIVLVIQSVWVCVYRSGRDSARRLFWREGHMTRRSADRREARRIRAGRHPPLTSGAPCDSTAATVLLYCRSSILAYRVMYVCTQEPQEARTLPDATRVRTQVAAVCAGAG